MKTLTVALSALAIAAGTIVAAPRAEAQTAARVESQTRPNFGLLLDPPARQGRVRQHRRWNYGTHRRDWRPTPLPPYSPGGGEEIVLVDCGGNPGTGAVENAVQRVRPGGTLILRARGGACVGWLNVDKPLTIIGEGGFDPRRWNENPPITLQAPDGLPCITAAQGVRVEIRDLVIASPRAGDAACIVGYGAQIVMSRVGIRHTGDEAAIYADGGLVDMRDTVIDAQTVSPAIIADGATLNAYETVVTGAQSGIELTPGDGEPSRLQAVSLIGVESPNSFGPRAIGLWVRARRDYGRVEVSFSRICGYSEGVAIDGASVSITDTRICKADNGVVLYNGEVAVSESRIRANSVGVLALAGRAVITNNVFSRVRTTVASEGRASVEETGSRVWTHSELCRPQLDWRYRDRYSLSWGPNEGRSYRCDSSPYPQQWWAEEEGYLGEPYYNDGYNIDGYSAYGRGDGWYDCEGRYINDTRYRGNDRWSQGGWGGNRACRRARGSFFPIWARISVEGGIGSRPPPGGPIVLGPRY
ncbi:MAG: hypothetical protein KKA16_06370 [Alphaproteobacteria bacterium]|nr:hypothetical protein [Alphaproteobacteria bacterium]MBU2378403.1 hypothetical protein [Alphaproteobacteria bacterium]